MPPEFSGPIFCFKGVKEQTESFYDEEKFNYFLSIRIYYNLTIIHLPSFGSHEMITLKEKGIRSRKLIQKRGLMFQPHLNIILISHCPSTPNTDQY